MGLILRIFGVFLLLFWPLAIGWWLEVPWLIVLGVLGWWAARKAPEQKAVPPPAPSIKPRESAQPVIYRAPPAPKARTPRPDRRNITSTPKTFKGIRPDIRCPGCQQWITDHPDMPAPKPMRDGRWTWTCANCGATVNQ